MAYVITTVSSISILSSIKAIHLYGNFKIMQISGAASEHEECRKGRVKLVSFQEMAKIQQEVCPEEMEWLRPARVNRLVYGAEEKPVPK